MCGPTHTRASCSREHFPLRIVLADHGHRCDMIGLFILCILMTLLSFKSDYSNNSQCITYKNIAIQ